jgi:hypothetical protein
MAVRIDVDDLPPVTLEFGAPGAFTDPKAGLAQGGPFSLRFGAAHKAQVRVGLVGPQEMLTHARAWFERCQSPIASGRSSQAMYPDFPGFRATFHASLDLDSRWHVELETHELQEALRLAPRERFQALVDLYARGVERLANRDIRPDVTVCCLPEAVIRDSGSISNTALAPKARQWARWQQKARATGQLALFEEWDVEETEEDLLYRDLRRALKARVMHYRMPIQIGTVNLFLDKATNQDPATRAWNVCLALFYKAGGLPWRLKTDSPETCFVGVSFHHLQTSHRHLVYSSLAQAFPTEGDGFALRGDAVPWDAKQGRTPHLTDEQAARLAQQVLIEYRERTGRDPARVVLHKTSKFDAPERAGFVSALRHVPIVELVNLRPAAFRLVQDGLYPPKRGTLCRVNGAATYLFTTGYIPEWGTYPGPHIPVPVQLVTDDEADMRRIAADVLGLSRMNWNTACDTSGWPITLRFAREVGGIMAEFGPTGQPNPSYRYYM